MKRLLIAGAVVLCLAACGADETTEENEMNGTEEETSEHGGSGETEEADAKEGRVISPDRIQMDTVAENLEAPWNISYAEDVFYITERDGQIAVIDESGKVERQKVETSAPVLSQGEGGLLGMALAEDFDASRQAYLYYTYQSEGELYNRVVLVTEEEGVWTEEEVIVDRIPGDGIHNGGRIKLGEDGFLYVTTGDANIVDLSQDEESLAGKILRVGTDGEIPDDNPWDDSLVYSYGHRNPQGLAWIDGTLYSSEHGPTAHDEINIIEPGLNYGWPVIKGDEEEEGMETPLVHSGDDTWAPSGIENWEGTLVVAGLRGESLFQLNEETMELTVLFEGEGRIRDVFAVGDSLYLITNNTDGRGNPGPGDDRLLRLKLDE
ncbi:PQQ-dependent sugar dehydrogenase [Bacillus sp. H-16]|uniref:PQQ-dependent sugar dehydrogenase n=1 Tax=Alteribacter salitolerans TaxID=2912333 RepID=UPI0019624976|nr:PQQ-dependent sugar dehydrogenase [Alteribacter salitolerans]MBM7096310.1 PQQ-dependent sugar dehydrogenase [Alteribacter salitolerans]